jgi:hypothetical protein
MQIVLSWGLYIYTSGVVLIGLPLFIKALIIEWRYHQHEVDLTSKILLGILIIYIWPISLFWFCQETRSLGEHTKLKQGDTIFYKHGKD